ncbi:MAG: hypothetical protein HY582_03950 [Candidatus Omnitrophica bacterium]|nr:hypothetical protein [Candidatus Omnitrophota bacterium]
MKNIARIIFSKLTCFLVLIMLSGLWWNPLLFSEEENAMCSDALLIQKLTDLEKKIEKVQQNQKLISEKHTEIKSELTSLRIWINKRR